MNYTVLALKYRPQKFEDVIGQRHVVQSLRNALEMGRVAHAFLFSGTRGVGKTTTARLLAKSLNCENGPTTDPCGVCDACKEITRGTSVDVIEIDGASNTGVDNVRELRENVKYAPARGRHKVYIIDEVHMLSTAAFNALLKTLEEPPPHVVFIFATTDPHKVPATILSRCQHYDFRRTPKPLLEEHLKNLCEKEGIKAEPAALARVATLAEGSVRDSLSLLDQVVSYCGEDGLRAADIDDILGLVGREPVKKTAAAITAQDPAAAVEAVAGLVDSGIELRRFGSSLLEFYRDMLVSRLPGVSERVLELPEAEVEELKRLASSVAPEEVIRVMNILTRLAEEFKWSQNHRISLELALVKAASRPVGNIDEIIENVKRLKDSPGGQAGGQSRPPRVAEERTAPPAKRGHVEDSSYDSPAPPAGPAHGSAAVEVWDRIRAGIKAVGKAPLASKMNNCAPTRLEGGVLTVVEGFLPFKPEEIALINEAAAKVDGGYTVKTGNGEGQEKAKTLSDVKKEREHTRKEQIKSEALEHPLVKSAIDLFGGEVVEVNEDKP